MSLVVVGSVALDTIETPQARVDEILGGSAVHFSLAASLLTEVRLVGVIGMDLPDEHLEMLGEHGIDLAGLQKKDGKTFRWTGRYLENMNVRETLAVELNVFGDHEPEVPPGYRDSEFLFLANGSPVHQMHVLEQMAGPCFAVVDTMDHWIESSRPELEALLKRMQAVVVNDSEAKHLTGDDPVRAARKILDMGPEYVVVKKGEHGACLAAREGTFLLPAFPVEDVRDPTGAGDSFAGGMMGHLARVGKVTFDDLELAMAYGTILASFNVEDFGVKRTAGLTLEEVEARLKSFREMLAF